MRYSPTVLVVSWRVGGGGGGLFCALMAPQRCDGGSILLLVASSQLDIVCDWSKGEGRQKNIVPSRLEVEHYVSNPPHTSC